MFRFIGFGEKAGSGADIIAKGWEENHWARPTIKDSYFPSEETELILDLLKEGDQGTIQTTTQTTTQTAAQTTAQRIIECIRKDSSISRDKLAELCGITADGVKWQLKQLQAKGLIRRVGADFGGHWEIIE